MSNPITAILLSYLKCFNFWGRASRSEFWWFHIYAFLLFFWVVAPELSHNLHHDLPRQNMAMFLVFGLIMPSATLSIRRMHDTNRSAWWLALSFVPLVGLLPVLNNALISGDHNANSYGPPPN